MVTINIQDEDYYLRESEVELLLKANYLTQDNNGIYRNNSSLDWNVIQKLTNLKNSEILRENQEENFDKVKFFLEEVFKDYSLHTTYNETFGILNGTYINTHIKSTDKPTMFRLNRDLIRHCWEPFISVYFDYNHRTISINGHVRCEVRGYRRKSFQEVDYQFINYRYAYSVPELIDKTTVDLELLNQFVGQKIKENYD